MSLESSQDENETIKRIREDREAVLAEKKKLEEEKAALATELQTLRAEKLTEQQKTQLELEELREIKSKYDITKVTAEQNEKALNGMYEQELSKVPEAKKEAVKALSSHGTAGERLANLRNALGLMGVTESFGTSTEPTTSTSVKTETKKVEGTPLDPKVKVSWNGAGGFFDPEKTKEVLARTKQQ